MDLIDAIRAAGVVGSGGAGFPTHVKLDVAASCLIINAAEDADRFTHSTYFLSKIRTGRRRSCQNRARIRAGLHIILDGGA